jgi:hypothetical protein
MLFALAVFGDAMSGAPPRHLDAAGRPALLASLIGVAPSRGAVRLPAKIEPGPIEHEDARAIHLVLETPRLRRLLSHSHVGRLFPRVIRGVAAHHSLVPDAVLVDLAHEGATELAFAHVAHVARVAAETLALGEGLGLADGALRVRRQRDVEGLLALHARWAVRFRASPKFGPRSYEDDAEALPEPRAPLPPDDRFVPLTSLSALAKEAAGQKSCVGEYGPRLRHLNGYCVLVRVRGPVAATLELFRVRRRWRRGPEGSPRFNLIAGTDSAA